MRAVCGFIFPISSPVLRRWISCRESSCNVYAGFEILYPLDFSMVLWMLQRLFYIRLSVCQKRVYAFKHLKRSSKLLMARQLLSSNKGRTALASRPLLGEKMVVCNKLRWYAVRTAASGYGVRCQLLVSERGEAWL